MRYRRTLLLSTAVILVLVTAGCMVAQTGNTTDNSSTVTPQTVVPASTTAAGAAGTSCSSGMIACSDGYCHDTTSDHNACGGCGNVCPTGDICKSSVCVVPATQGTTTSATVAQTATTAGSSTVGTSCPSGTTACSDGYCHDTTSDHNACGGCGNVCPTGDICSSSVCVAPATQGTTTSATTAPTVTATTAPAVTTTVATVQTLSKIQGLVLVTVAATPGDVGGGCTSLPTPYSLTSISPASGPVAGGTAVTISGTGFQNAVMSVYFGNTKIMTLSNSMDGTTIWVTSPKASSAGTVDIRVVGGSGILGDSNSCATSVTSADRFTYTA
jgi:hypothetical protein